VIPLSVRMKGWMRYRDEEVADFNGASLIAIVGENGAGKSSIFDAITFALYGVHRLGKMHAADLISQDMDRLSVDFEFEVDGQRYMVHRGRGRRDNERDQGLWIWDDGAGDWTIVGGTEREDSLRQTLERVVRLSPEAFTSSFMLQQGGATEFLDADPQPRFNIISGLIGLQAYEALEKGARESAKDEKKKLDELTAKLAEFDGIDASSLDALRADVATAVERESAAAELLIAATGMLADARRHATLVGEIAGLDGQIAEAEGLIAEREKIESDAEMHKTFKDAVGKIERVRAAVDDATRAEAAARAAADEGAQIDVAALAAAHETASKGVAVAEAASAAADRERAKMTEAERAAHEFASAAAAILDARAGIVERDARLAESAPRVAELTAAIGGAETAAAASAKDVARHEDAVDAARTDGAESRARVETLKSQLSERKAAAKEAVCARCGQKIDKKAAKSEVDTLTASLADAAAAANTATAAERAAVKALADAKKAQADAASALQRQSKELHGLQAARAEIESERGRAAESLAALEKAAGKRLSAVAGAQAARAAAAAALKEAEAARGQAKREEESARAGETKARAALERGRASQAKSEANAREQAAKAAGYRDQAAAFASGLGELGEKALADPRSVLEVVRGQQAALAEAPERKRALETALRDHDRWTAQREVKRADVAAIPEAHRVGSDEAEEVSRQADADARAAKASLQETQQRLASLEARIEQVEAMRADKERATKRRKQFQKLQRLLGKQGLQGVLVTDALATITTHANTFLQRLTGGTLRLEIKRGERDDALDLQAIDSTCMREPRSVKVLSGSQKFRCAVAIASGIGQYAGAGGMRSIVIDEGFASLDQAGQRQMVEELKDLSTHMDKVIVVSHLETFTDQANFPDRIMVETHGTGSHIRKLF
jgi:DNA repair exonuclease SbcCD ATPase subunit